MQEQCASEAPLVARCLEIGADPYQAAAEVLDALDLDAAETANQFESASTSAREPIARIPTNESFFAACATELGRSQTLRLTIVGPTFLEPEWLHQQAGDMDVNRNFSLALRRRLFAGNLHCEVILRNVRDRYLRNLAEFVHDGDQWERLLDEMLVDSFRLLGEHGERGPRLRCFNPGFNHIPHVFDDAAFVATRRSAAERVTGGWQFQTREMIDLERERWSSMFEAAAQQQSDAVQLLREFVESLRDGYPGKAT